MTVLKFLLKELEINSRSRIPSSNKYYSSVKLIYLGESLRNITVSWVSHFSRSSVIFNFENLLLHNYFWR